MIDIGSVSNESQAKEAITGLYDNLKEVILMQKLILQTGVPLTGWKKYIRNTSGIGIVAYHIIEIHVECFITWKSLGESSYLVYLCCRKPERPIN